MNILTLARWTWPADAVSAPTAPPKPDWPLMCDVATVRAGVPEALIHWRRAEGASAPHPNDPDLRQNSL